jgi:YD repeat-containing protein
VHPSRENSLESIGGALDRLHMDETAVDDEDIEAIMRPSAKALGKRRVVEEVDEGTLRSHLVCDDRMQLADASLDVDHYDSSDLYYEPRRESIVLESDEDGRGGETWLPRRQPTQYVYDAAAERTAQHLREGRVGVAVNGVH